MAKKLGFKTCQNLKDRNGLERDSNSHLQFTRQPLIPDGHMSSGLAVMGDDSCSKGRGFKSWRRILDGHFSHCFVVNIVSMFV